MDNDGMDSSRTWAVSIASCRVLSKISASARSLVYHLHQPCSSPQRKPLPCISLAVRYLSLADLLAQVSHHSHSGTSSRTRRATRTATIAKSTPTWHSPDSVSSPSRTATWRQSESSVLSVPSALTHTHISLQLPQSFPVRTPIPNPSPPPLIRTSLGTRSRRQRLDKASPGCHL